MDGCELLQIVSFTCLSVNDLSLIEQGCSFTVIVARSNSSDKFRGASLPA